MVGHRCPPPNAALELAATAHPRGQSGTLPAGSCLICLMLPVDPAVNGNSGMHDS
jgi:hypothetical protein